MYKWLAIVTNAWGFFREVTNVLLMTNVQV